MKMDVRRKDAAEGPLTLALSPSEGEREKLSPAFVHVGGYGLTRRRSSFG